MVAVLYGGGALTPYLATEPGGLVLFGLGLLILGSGVLVTAEALLRGAWSWILRRLP